MLPQNVEGHGRWNEASLVMQASKIRAHKKQRNEMPVDPNFEPKVLLYFSFIKFSRLLDLEIVI